MSTVWLIRMYWILHNIGWVYTDQINIVINLETISHHGDLSDVDKLINSDPKCYIRSELWSKPEWTPSFESIQYTINIGSANLTVKVYSFWLFLKTSQEYLWVPFFTLISILIWYRDCLISNQFVAWENTFSITQINIPIWSLGDE